METNLLSKEESSKNQIKWIKERIDSEFRKHSNSEGLDWSLIAAIKIVATLNESYEIKKIE